MPLAIGLMFLFVLFVSLFCSRKYQFGPQNYFSKMGTWSYGLYVLHLAIIHILLKFCQKNAIRIDSILSFSVFGITCLTISLLISYLSFRYFEKPFVDLKL
jgi:peptidoglycan/LPS O-acetylase OafA/YrhL